MMKTFFLYSFADNVIKAVRAATFGDYNYSHDWVCFNGAGNLDSFTDVSMNVDLQDIANDILENPHLYDIELEDEDNE